MPNDRVIETIYLGPFTNVEAVNTSTLFHPGELGARVALTQTGVGSKEYQFVQLDSGATAAADLAPAAGQLVYWKSKSNYIVTNSVKQALGAQSVGSTNNAFRNEVAGVLTVAATPGNYCFVQQKGNNTGVLMTSGSPFVGDQLVAQTSSATGVIVAAGTAPTVQSLGKFAAAGSSITSGNVDLDIPGIP